MYNIEWSPSRPCVFACSSQMGNILVYDLLDTRSNASETINASEVAVHALAFNGQRPGYLASGDRNGVVKIWHLAHELAKSENMTQELKKLNDIAEKPFEK